MGVCVYVCVYVHNNIYTENAKKLSDNWFTTFAELKELDNDMMVQMQLNKDIILGILQFSGKGALAVAPNV